MADNLTEAFRQSVEEGAQRVHRTWPALLATGMVGGIDVSVGVLAALIVRDHTGNELAAALAFSIGFIALTLAGSELFTENFLLPVAAVAAKKARVGQVLRLWVGTALTNLLGGFVMMVIIVHAFPDVGDTAAEVGNVFVSRGIGLQGFSSAVLAGIVITLMTWMQSGASTLGGRLVAAISAAFLLSFGHLSHVIVASLEVFAGILTGAPYGYAEWFGMFLLWAAGNAVGGIALVTLLRLVQVGPRRVAAERKRHVDVSEGDESRSAAEAAGGDDTSDADDADPEDARESEPHTT